MAEEKNVFDLDAFILSQRRSYEFPDIWGGEGIGLTEKKIPQEIRDVPYLKSETKTVSFDFTCGSDSEHTKTVLEFKNKLITFGELIDAIRVYTKKIYEEEQNLFEGKPDWFNLSEDHGKYRLTIPLENIILYSMCIYRDLPGHAILNFVCY